jgi:hypothetical protein
MNSKVAILVLLCHRFTFSYEVPPTPPLHSIYLSLNYEKYRILFILIALLLARSSFLFPLPQLNRGGIHERNIQPGFLGKDPSLLQLEC